MIKKIIQPIKSIYQGVRYILRNFLQPFFCDSKSGKVKPPFVWATLFLFFFASGIVITFSLVIAFALNRIQLNTPEMVFTALGSTSSMLGVIAIALINQYNKGNGKFNLSEDSYEKEV